MPKLVTINAADATPAADGSIPLAAGARVSLRLWRDEEPTDDKTPRRHDYEVVGYALSGRAALEIAGEMVELKAGDSWLVPAGATHTYRIIERFSAVEAVAPPA
ncbi:cupin domain-containing protein [Lichenihabitans sp. Uapishka_5]|uniref:cupin domain-containing protein n=1 Tax=Lichenihabitans sp. Uapishka_5 TaxID=3037302 RepID=UPI0029E82217|nr:cupin domain-containing protein [Lichenihabitans sp. Uapishka_5]MDX7951122.1 cupin domain-containing protein [Lichenihabitans sp. Uapishka_5]